MLRTSSTLVAALFTTLALCSATLAAPRNDDNQSNDQGQQSRDQQNYDSRNSSTENNRHETFLGVAVAPLDESLRSHLKNEISDGSGLLVVDVADGSPAAKAGIREHDILISFDDQRLYSPEQLVRLVENDRPGREAKLHIVRSGKSEHIAATLGSNQMAFHTRAHRANSWPMTNQQRQDQQGYDNQRQSREGQWQSFDAMTLSRLDKDHFKAEIRYRDDGGNIESRQFQGTAREIRHDIDNQKDLPRAERDRLSRALETGDNPNDVEFQEYHYSNQRS